eukprot:Em0016g345a
MSTDVSPKKSRLSSPDSEEQGSRTTKKRPNPGKGADPTKPKCRKAKDIRREKRLLKMAKVKDSDAKSAPPSVMDVGTPVDKPVGTPVDGPEEEEEEGEGANGEQPQDLLDLVTLPDPKDCVHKLEIKLLKSWPRTAEISATFASSYAVFKKFQSIVHLDDHNCDEKHYSDFIVESPLLPPAVLARRQTWWQWLCWTSSREWSCGEYFFYDPSYRFLSLGVYSAIREIAFVRELGQWPTRTSTGAPSSCAPWTLRYMPIEKCLPKLEVNKYCKLGEGEAEEEEALDIDALTVYREMLPMPYREYRTSTATRTVNMLREYGKVMGSKVGRRMKVNLTFC